MSPNASNSSSSRSVSSKTSTHIGVANPLEHQNQRQLVQIRDPVPANWNASKIPSMVGKVAIVTGGSSGIGLEVALELACKGAHVVVACPAHLRVHASEERIRVTAQATEVPVYAGMAAQSKKQQQYKNERGSVEYMELDLSDLSSVKRFASSFLATHSRLDVLVNNAGIMGVAFARTVDGHERQFATNYLGHFVLTHYLLDVMRRTDGVSRVVTTTSLSHRFVDLDAAHVMDTNADSYIAMAAYAKSKLCCIMFAVELDRRLQVSGVENVMSVASHPGYARTGIMGPPAVSASSWFARTFWDMWSFAPFAQSAAMGALPTLFAATASSIRSGDLYGPNSAFFHMWGCPALETPAPHAQSQISASRLWTASETLAKIRFDVAGKASAMESAAE